MTPNIFTSTLIKNYPHNHARAMKMSTPHGEVLTPAFMPVGTRAFVNLMTPQDLLTAQSQIILGGNTYHMLCSPGMETLEKAGGMHQLMGWHHPMLTDSGGFQVLSLSKNGKLCKIKEDGAHFKHPVSGKLIHLTPQTSIQAQKVIGADIIMAFDECTPEEGGRTAALAAMERTHRWLRESKETHEKQPCSAYGFQQALFGIIQGGSFQDLREQSARVILDLDLDGIAIGGEIIGFNMPKTCEVVNYLRPMLPENKIRYTMGVGATPQDLFDVVATGIDIFDCVAPTRNARHGALYHGRIVEKDGWLTFESTEDQSRILIKKQKYATDQGPICEDCTCYTCQHFSKAYLHFLFKAGSALFSNLACVHNIHMMQEACRRMRELIMTCEDERKHLFISSLIHPSSLKL
jgi:queuine tRNA-ribosyltransferase